MSTSPTRRWLAAALLIITTTAGCGGLAPDRSRTNIHHITEEQLQDGAPLRLGLQPGHIYVFAKALTYADVTLAFPNGTVMAMDRWLAALRATDTPLVRDDQQRLVVAIPGRPDPGEKPVMVDDGVGRRRARLSQPSCFLCSDLCFLPPCCSCCDGFVCWPH